MNSISKKITQKINKKYVVALIIFIVAIFPLHPTINEFIFQCLIPFTLSVLSSLNDTTLIISILGIFATVSVTFITLLFAIAAINASFQTGNNSNHGDYISEGGSYPLKLLIKVDLMSTALRTIIPQLGATIIFFIVCPIVQKLSDTVSDIINSIFGILVILVLSTLLYFLIRTLWNTTNSVYYSIVQSNYDYLLSSTLTTLNMGGYFSLIKSYYPQPYDVYAVRKTLYPKIHKWTYNRLQQDTEKDFDKISKEELVDIWNIGFGTVLEDTLSAIRKKLDNKTTLIMAIKQEGEQKNLGLLKMLKPKIQAPEKVTKICLDLLYHAPMSKEMDLIPYDKETLEQCLILLAAHKYYAERRQEERKKHNVRINRARYSNPNDMHAYMLYGYILYLLGEYEYRGMGNIDSAKDYYTESICSYRCATIANPINKDAKNNLATLINYVNRPPLSVDIPKYIITRYKS